MLLRRLAVLIAAVLVPLLALTTVPATAAPVGPGTTTTNDATGGESVGSDEVADPDPTAAAEDTADEAEMLTRRGPHNVRVGTFNIKNVMFARNPSRDWRERRAVIIRQVRESRIGILGIQEAHPGRYTGVNYPDGENQYLDLMNGLNKAGANYGITSAASYNCVNPDHFNNCRYKDRGASRSTRILYNKDRFELLDRGSVLYKKQTSEDRYLVWAKFRSRITGAKFLFTTTHLATGRDAVRLAQWRQSIRVINRLRGSMPVIATGDYNVQKYHPIAREMLPAMKNNGYGDVLNQRYATNPSNDVRAEETRNAWINSYTHGRRDVKTFSFHNQRQKVGNGIDWVFASNNLKVKSYKIVCDYDPDSLMIRGALPSDHVLVTSTIQIA